MQALALNAGLGAAPVSVQARRLAALCEVARTCGIPVLTLPADKAGTPVSEAGERLAEWVRIAEGTGVVLTVETHVGQLTEQPDVAVELCESVPGLGLTLDPSHYYAGPAQGGSFDGVFPFVRHVHTRDSGRDWAAIQVPHGTGLVNFDRLIRKLAAVSYAGAVAVEYINSIGNLNVEEACIRMRDTLVTGMKQ